MADITIPDEAREAGRNAFYEAEANRKSTDDALRAAYLAMLKHWPGAWTGVNGAIILPLHKENTND